MGVAAEAQQRPGAARVTVFTETARRVAIRTGIASGSQLIVMPHGAPVVMRTPPAESELRSEISNLIAHVRGKPTLTTFGLLSRGKGIDIAIDALAQVVHQHPDTQYIVAGKTHPEVARHEGEMYRERLKAQVNTLGLDKNVHFVDAFLTLDELSAILHASTVFVTPYRSPEQVCSGALTFALGAGLGDGLGRGLGARLRLGLCRRGAELLPVEHRPVHDLARLRVPVRRGHAR